MIINVEVRDNINGEAEPGSTGEATYPNTSSTPRHFTKASASITYLIAGCCSSYVEETEGA